MGDNGKPERVPEDEEEEEEEEEEVDNQNEISANTREAETVTIQETLEVVLDHKEEEHQERGIEEALSQKAEEL